MSNSCFRSIAAAVASDIPAVAVTPWEAAARHARESCHSVNETNKTAVNGNRIKANRTAESHLVIFMEDYCTPRACRLADGSRRFVDVQNSVGRGVPRADGPRPVRST